MRLNSNGAVLEQSCCHAALKIMCTIPPAAVECSMLMVIFCANIEQCMSGLAKFGKKCEVYTLYQSRFHLTWYLEKTRAKTVPKS